MATTSNITGGNGLIRFVCWVDTVEVSLCKHKIGTSEQMSRIAIWTKAFLTLHPEIRYWPKTIPLFDLRLTRLNQLTEETPLAQKDFVCKLKIDNTTNLLLGDYPTSRISKSLDDSLYTLPPCLIIKQQIPSDPFPHILTFEAKAHQRDKQCFDKFLIRFGEVLINCACMPIEGSFESSESVVSKMCKSMLFNP